MSYNVTLNKQLPSQGVYDQLMGGHIDDRKLVRLYPRASSGPYRPEGPNRICFRIPDQGHIDTLRSYMTYTVRIYADQDQVFTWGTTEAFLQGSTGAQITAMHQNINTLNKIRSSNDPPHLRDTTAYMLGGINGSSGSVFSRYRMLVDNEQVEDIEEYHGLTAALNMNVPAQYRASAAGHLQFMHPRGSREMILNALVRGGSVLTQTMYKKEGATTPIGGFDTSNLQANASELKKTEGTSTTVTEYKNLMHLPTSGILSSSKFLPAKFMAPIDVEFTLAPTVEALQIASGLGACKLVSTHIGALVNGPRTLRVRGLGNNDGNTAVANSILRYATDDISVARHLWSHIQLVVNGSVDSYANAAGVAITNAEIDKWVINDKYTRSIRYEIVDPVYHVECVYMSESYDAAFAQALTRGVTYAYETYAYTSSTINNDGIVQVPINKTSVKSILTGFVNTSVRDSLLSNYWHFVNPNIDHYQFRFGSKMIPMEPVHVHDDNGLEALMLYLKSVGMRYEAHAGLNTGWSQSAYTAVADTRAGELDMVSHAVVSNTFGASEPGPNTWCLGSGRTAKNGDVYRILGDNPSTADLNAASVIANNKVSVTNVDDTGYNGVAWNEKIASSNNGLRTLYSYNVGSFMLGLDLEAEQGALSGINTSGSTSMMEWDLKFKQKPGVSMVVHTWLRHDKAIRLEPFGRVSIMLD